MCDENLKKGGDYVKLTGESGRVWGAVQKNFKIITFKAIRSTDETIDPIIVSLGHKISLETTVKIVTHCCKFRVPEPVNFPHLFLKILD
jgi:deoxyinosine 3'endonuclease (endonuclease V)